MKPILIVLAILVLAAFVVPGMGQESANALYIQGVALQALGKTTEANDSFAKAVDLGVHDVNELHLYNFIGPEACQEGVSSADCVIQQNPKDVDAWINNGCAFLDQGKYDEAIDAFDEVIQLDPNNSLAWFNKGIALEKTGNPEANDAFVHADELVDEAIRLNPKDADAWNDYVDAWSKKGIALQRLGRQNEANAAFDTADQLTRHPPNSTELTNAIDWTNKGITLLDQNKYDKAIEVFDEAISIDRNYGDAWYNKGLALQRLNRTTAANDAFVQAEELGKTGPETEQADQAMRTASTVPSYQPEPLNSEFNQSDLGDISNYNRVKDALYEQLQSLETQGRTIEADAVQAKINELENARTTTVLDHSMARNIDESNRSAITRSHEFFVGDSKAYSWVSLENVPGNTVVWWEWWPPAGNSGGTPQTSRVDIPEPTSGATNIVGYWKSYNVWAHLDIAGHYPANLTGDWHVKIFVEGDQLLTDDFSIEYQQPNGTERLPSQGPEGQQPISPDSLNQSTSNSLVEDVGGDDLVALGRYDEAIQAYNKSIELYPTKDYRAWGGKGDALMGLGKYDEAVQCYDKAIEICQNQTDYWNERAQEADAHGEWYWDCPHPSPIAGETITVYCTKTNSSVQYYTLSDSWRSDLGPYLNAKGTALKHLTKYDEAIQAYDKAIEINPQDASAWYNKGDALDDQGKHNEATQAYDNAIEIDPRDADVWKGNTLYDQGKFNESIQAYDNAIEIDPNYAEAWYEKGIALLAKGKYDMAIQACDKATEINPQFAQAWNNKGVALTKLGYTTNANEAFAKAKDLGYNVGPSRS